MDKISENSGLYPTFSVCPIITHSSTRRTIPVAFISIFPSCSFVERWYCLQEKAKYAKILQMFHVKQRRCGDFAYHETVITVPYPKIPPGSEEPGGSIKIVRSLRTEFHTLSVSQCLLLPHCGNLIRHGCAVPPSPKGKALFRFNTPSVSQRPVERAQWSDLTSGLPERNGSGPCPVRRA